MTSVDTSEFVQQPGGVLQHLAVLLMTVEEKQSDVKPQPGVELMMKPYLIFIQTSEKNVSYKENRFNGAISFHVTSIDICSF